MTQVPTYQPRRVQGRVVGLALDKAIVNTPFGRIVCPWLEEKPELDDQVDVQGTSVTGDNWTWIITGPATEPTTLKDAPPDSRLGRLRARIYSEALNEAVDIVTRRGSSYEACIDILARAAEVEIAAGIA